jgi:hypothetical protein
MFRLTSIIPVSIIAIDLLRFMVYTLYARTHGCAR